MTPPAIVIVAPSGFTRPNCVADAFWTAGAASERMKVGATPLTAVSLAVAVGFAGTLATAAAAAAAAACTMAVVAIFVELSAVAGVVVVGAPGNGTLLGIEITPFGAISVVPSGFTRPNCVADAFWTAGAASERMKVGATPLTAVSLAVAVGFAGVPIRSLLPRWSCQRRWNSGDGRPALSTIGVRQSSGPRSLGVATGGLVVIVVVVVQRRVGAVDTEHSARVRDLEDAARGGEGAQRVPHQLLVEGALRHRDGECRAERVPVVVAEGQVHVGAGVTQDAGRGRQPEVRHADFVLRARGDAARDDVHHRAEIVVIRVGRGHFVEHGIEQIAPDYALLPHRSEEHTSE